MKVKGIVTYELTDENGNIKETRTLENWVFDDIYKDLVIGNRRSSQIAIYVSEEDKHIYPHTSRKSKGFYPENLSGIYGLTSKTFFPKTQTSAPYWEFFHVYPPSTKRRTISSVSLSVGINPTTSINLNPPCIQETTEYLNIYYRLIFEDTKEDFENSETAKEWYIRNIFEQTYTLSKTSLLNYIYSYAYDIKEDLFTENRILNAGSGDNGRENKRYYLGTYSTPAWNKDYSLMGSPIGGEFRSLNNIIKYDFSPASDIDYEQALDRPFFRNLLRCEGYTNNSNVGVEYLHHPIKYTDDIGENGNTGIGNVFSSNSETHSFEFDGQYFPKGTGEVIVDGVWKRDDPETINNSARYRIEIVKSGDRATDCQYRIKEFHTIAPEKLILAIPNNYSALVHNKNRYHINTESLDNYRVYQKDRSFLCFDDLGVTVYDILNGTLTSYDAESTPPLGAVKINDVKVDSVGNIWVSCYETGLWKIEPNEEKTIIQNFNAPSGVSKNRTFALATDDNMGVYIIYYDLGLFYTFNGGVSFVNAIITDEYFFGLDEQGISKWERCRAIACYPKGDLLKGTAKVLIWGEDNLFFWDTISADVLRVGCGGYSYNPNMFKQTQHLAFDNTGEYFFFGYSARKWRNNENIEYNSRYTSSTFPVTFREWYNQEKAVYEQGWVFSYGDIDEVISVTKPNANENGVFDWDVIKDDVKNRPNDKALILGDKSAIYLQNKSLFVRAISNNDLTNERQNDPFVTTVYGWDGTDWVANHPSLKNGHLDAQPFLEGITIKFVDGKESTTSFSIGDRHGFTCFDGFYKDNSSRMWLRDIIYFKPRETITTFTPDVVTLQDHSTEAGLLYDKDIHKYWNILESPESQFDGSPIITEGDNAFSKVIYLNRWETDNGGQDVSNYNWEPAETYGDLIASINNQVPNGQTVAMKLDGNSGIYYAPSKNLTLGKTSFSVELWVKPMSALQDLYLIDWRENAENEQGAFLIRNGKLCFIEYGNREHLATTELPLDQWSFVTLNCAVNGSNYDYTITQNDKTVLSFTINNAFSENAKPMHLFKRAWKYSSWQKQINNDKWTDNIYKGIDSKLSAWGYVPSSTRGLHFLKLPFNNMQAGTYTFSIYAKRSAGRYMAFYMKKQGSNYSGSDRAIYDWENGNFAFTSPAIKATYLKLTDQQTLEEGWYRFTITKSIQSVENIEVCFGVTDHFSIAENSEWYYYTGNDTSPVFLFQYPQLEKNASASPYQPAPSPLNYIQETDNPSGSYYGFKGYISTLRITKGITRENSYQIVGQGKDFESYAPSYQGANIIFSNKEPQGAILSKYELVGDFEVQFKSIPFSLWKNNRRYRPRGAFGITAHRNPKSTGDITWRFMYCLDNYNKQWVMFEKANNNHSGEIAYNNQWYDNDAFIKKLEFSEFHYPIGIRIVKGKDNYITFYINWSDDVFDDWKELFKTYDLTPVYKIVLWQESHPFPTNFPPKEKPKDPITGETIEPDRDEDGNIIQDLNAEWIAGDQNTIMPAVYIIKNGSAIYSVVGDPETPSGAYHKHFICADLTDDRSFVLNLDGMPPTRVRNKFFDTDLSEGEVMQSEIATDENGYIMFNGEDIGKKITGRVVTLHD